MAQKITQGQINQMITLYKELGTYSAVSKQMGVSASTVSKYLKGLQSIKIYSTCLSPIPIEEISRENIISFSHLNKNEKESYNKWIKEFRE